MSIFFRLFLLIGLVSSTSLGIVAGLSWRNSLELERQLSQENASAGALVLRKGTGLLESNLRETHLMIVREKASRVESYFANIADAVQLEAMLIRQFLSDQSSSAAAPPLFWGNQLTWRAKADPSLKKTLVGVQPYCMYHLAPNVSLAKVRPSMEQLRKMGTFFAHTQQRVPGCDSTYFGSAEGFIQGYPGGRSFFKPAYDPRQRPWYLQATAPSQPPGTLIWEVDFDKDGKTLFLTCSRSVSLVGASKPAGVAAMDLSLPNVLSEMFNVGNLSVSKAILVDASERVRVSASYPLSKSSVYQRSSKAKPTFDTRNAKLKPPVASLPDFAPVAAYIRSHPAQKSGIYWPGIEDAKAMSEVGAKGSVFVYSSIRFVTGDDAPSAPVAQGDGGNWHYIIQLPMAPLLAPITLVTDEMQGSTNNISTAIRARTQKATALVLALIGGTLLVALSVSYFAARATSRPLIQMAQVARGVGQGNLDQQAVETSGGEIGEMGRAINAMIAGLRQRNLLQDTFGRYTAPSIVEEVLKRGGVKLGGEKSVATIFFSDLAGFTTLAEGLPPETLVALLNEYFDAMTKVILRSEGTLDKYIGDAILAFWGHPIAHDDDAARACRAALEQAEQLQLLCDKWEAEGRPRLQMRIGIETGEVIVGDIGSELKLNYTVLGDTVNFASRLEAVNKVYGTRILIGETTRRLAGDAIEAREIDLLAVVGKHLPVRVFELLGLAGTLSAARRQGYDSYVQGLEAYRQCHWDEAETCLRRAEATLGGDKASRVLLERVARLRHEPPAPDWDGSFILDHK